MSWFALELVNYGLLYEEISIRKAKLIQIFLFYFLQNPRTIGKEETAAVKIESNFTANIRPQMEKWIQFISIWTPGTTAYGWLCVCFG